MADSITGGIDKAGLAEMRRTYSDLKPKVRRSINRKALRKAGQPVLKLAKKGVSVRSGLTRKNLAMSVEVTNFAGSVSVGVKRRGSRGRSSIVHLIEDQSPFLEPALVAGRAQAVTRYGEAVREEIEKTLPGAL
jgi:hypothetical protein